MSGFWLVILLVAGILFIVISTAKYKLHPFLALLLTAYAIALCAGLPIADTVKTITSGFGGILAYIGIVIVLGTIIGTILEKTGAAITMADFVLRKIGRKRPVLAMSIIGYIVSIPVFCDSGFVILSSLKKSLIQQTGKSAVAMSVALSTGLYATHTLVPPTPGPIAAAGNLHVDNLGLVILVGLVVALFAALAGYLYAEWAGKRYRCAQDDLPRLSDDHEIKALYPKLPSTLNAFLPIIVPIALIAFASLLKLLFSGVDNLLLKYVYFFGEPVTALLIGLFFAARLLPEWSKTTLNDWIGQAVKDSGSILIITAAGGALGGVLKASGIGDYLGTMLQSMSLGILVPFVIAAALKTAQGSSTTALVVTSTIIYPLLPALGLDSTLGSVLAIMAIGAGAMTVSHANDSFFWVVAEFSEMDVATAYKSQTVATLVQGLVTITVVALLAWILL
ncbi:GntP family permease [Pasteurellaceae bacterium USgator11]|nr:GntP family permease [Pasteurellaceae bacterium USgator41]TNG94075.1 GntP family permease [Pasteurellaceae bacterium UScroc12]TNG97909.1 GntP family permease [Pasteurellaceae bacterium UScroc31]TNH02047.1 GntP family permease [Pasteurellaceae bacterium USgator11]